MKSTKDQRRPQDDYPTPAWVVHRLRDAIDSHLPDGAWLEPTAGQGAIIEAFADRPLKWTAVELQGRYSPTLLAKGADVTVGDYLEHRAPETRYAVAITNPPYGLAEAVVCKMLAEAKIVVALLRLNFLGSAKRDEFFTGQPTPWVGVLPNRPSFDGRGTDATEYAWFVWGVPALAGRWCRLGLTSADERRAGAVRARGWALL